MLNQKFEAASKRARKELLAFFGELPDDLDFTFPQYSKEEFDNLDQYVVYVALMIENTWPEMHLPVHGKMRLAEVGVSQGVGPCGESGLGLQKKRRPGFRSEPSLLARALAAQLGGRGRATES